MNKFQLCTRDEYNQCSIITSGQDIEDLIKKGKVEVDDLNFNNALTAEEKVKNWESFFIEFEDENIIYAGKDNKDMDIVYIINKDNIETCYLSDIEDEIKVYLGNLNNDSCYAIDERNNDIVNIGHRDLEAKTSYFIKKI